MLMKLTTVPPQQPVHVDGAVVLVGGQGSVLKCTSRSGEIELKKRPQRGKNEKKCIR